MKINKRKIQYASLSTVFIALFVVVVILLNILISFLANRFSLKIDLTQEAEYELSEETKLMLENLDEEVTIYIMHSEAEAMKKGFVTSAEQTQTSMTANYLQIVETIRRYNTASGGKVKYEFIDPNQNPKFFDDYPLAKTAEGGVKTDLIIAGEKRYDFIKENDLIRLSPTMNALYYYTEDILSAKILYVISDEVSKVARITGHNESPVPTLETVFENNGIDIVDVELRTQAIPDDVNNLLIAAPTADFTSEEIAKVDAFLQEPGNNIYIFWAGELASELPVFERFLNDWGMGIDKRVILDQSYSLAQDPISVYAGVYPSDVTKNLQQTQQPIVVENAHHINQYWEQKSYTRIMQIAVSSEESYARDYTADMNISAARTADEQKGPFLVAACAEKQVSLTNGESEYNRLFLFGSDGFANEKIDSITMAFNRTLLNETVSYSNEDTETIGIKPKISENHDLNLRKSQVETLQIILVFIIPLIILALGVIVFIRRRHR